MKLRHQKNTKFRHTEQFLSNNFHLFLSKISTVHTVDSDKDIN